MRPWVRCGRCDQSFRCTTDTEWVCGGCEADETADAVLAVTQAIQAALSSEVNAWIRHQMKPPQFDTCPYDGCLLRAGERCPACHARAAQRHLRTAPVSSTPPGWVRKPNGILVRKKVA